MVESMVWQVMNFVEIESNYLASLFMEGRYNKLDGHLQGNWSRNELHRANAHIFDTIIRSLQSIPKLIGVFLDHNG